jgi:hypothetical protein
MLPGRPTSLKSDRSFGGGGASSNEAVNGLAHGESVRRRLTSSEVQSGNARRCHESAALSGAAAKAEEAARNFRREIGWIM